MAKTFDGKTFQIYSADLIYCSIYHIQHEYQSFEAINLGFEKEGEFSSRNR